MKFYEFSQNNSGGYIIEDSSCGIGDYVYIQADEENEANERAESIGLFSLPYCDCCGERFYKAYENVSLDTDILIIERINISIYIHYKDGRKESLNIECLSSGLKPYSIYTFNIKDKTLSIKEN